MNILNRTVLAGLALCSMTFAQSAVAQDQVKSDVITKSLPQPAPLKPISVPTKPAKNKINNTLKSDKKNKRLQIPSISLLVSPTDQSKPLIIKGNKHEQS